MKPFSRIPKRALVALGAGVIALGVLGASGIGPSSAAAGSPQSASTPQAGAVRWAGQGGGPGFAISQPAVTSLLGMTAEEIRAQRLAGKSLADIAQTKGVSTDKLIATIVAAANERVAALVQSGTLTQAQADQCRQTVTYEVTTMVQSSGTGPRFAGRGLGHGMRGPGRGAMAPAASPTPGV
jgi:hypothetical protein